MIMRELEGNLFQASPDVVLAHCVSADCAMGAGIALQFRKQFRDMPAFCLMQNPEIGQAILYSGVDRRVINLVTKAKYFHKPTYSTLEAALLDMRRVLESNRITRISMPRIGCGLDRLQWGAVRQLIANTFGDMELIIEVYQLKA